MKVSRSFVLGVVALALVLPAAAASSLQAQTGAGIPIGKADIGGVVASGHGPEAGVWVIALTDDLPTKYAKIVVTDDRGRYLIPDLPHAAYSVWARGYGLVDSAHVSATPGSRVDLRPNVAPTEAAAARIYPAQYWYAMLHIPPKSDFPGTGPAGNGIMPDMKTQGEYLDMVKTDGCVTCHQLGNLATRTIPAAFGHFPNSAAAWGRRIQSGQAAGNMLGSISRMGPRALQEFGDWTDRIAKGELPFAKPPRPQGIERNVVITEWDWALPTTYLHDEVSTDKRNPRVNAYGKIYGTPEESSPDLPVLDPVRNVASFVRLPVLDPNTPSFGGTSSEKPLQPSAYWGDRRIWASQPTPHSDIFDERGDVWVTSRVRPSESEPAYCKSGDESAQQFPLQGTSREAVVYNPHAGKVLLANLCFDTQHLQLGYDADDTVWFSPGGSAANHLPSKNVLGWLNGKKFEQTADATQAQGWTPFVLDTLGTGVRTATFTEPGQPLDPTKDARVYGGFYGLAVAPLDGAVWGSVLGYPGFVARVVPGSDPARTALTEVFNLPADDPHAPVHGYSPRGMDLDHNGVLWAPLASGHLARFDRSRCTAPLNGPNALGNECPEGWTLYPFPGPQFKDVTDNGSAEAAYYDWVDQYDAVGLGYGVPYATGNEGDAIDALVNGKWVVMRVPYPLGFFAKQIDARIDDPRAGWKGRGLWTTLASRAPWHSETGKGTSPKVYHFQIRPNPLAD
jgi:hypothetical protein